MGGPGGACAYRPDGTIAREVTAACAGMHVRERARTSAGISESGAHDPLPGGCCRRGDRRARRAPEWIDLGDGRSHGDPSRGTFTRTAGLTRRLRFAELGRPSAYRRPSRTPT
jgi:hypothetical protein